MPRKLAIRFLLGIWFGGLSLMGCTPDSLDYESYLDHLQTQRAVLSSEETAGSYRFSLTVEPSDLHAYRTLPDSVDTDQKWLEWSSQKSRYLYANLRISSLDPSKSVMDIDTESPGAYGARVSYLAFMAQHDLRLVTGQDTLAPQLYHFERTFEAAPFVNCQILFPEPPGSANPVLHFDGGHFGVGPIHLEAKLDELKKLPTLNFPE
ncbi:hypothetical protein [Pontibacter sp. G13]|uniref:hypothetical protein n=1 Tax=Pontibacter sp. G13 TaxID=3074898 RepID=UPI00288BCDC6|nr:hypothetical protein [Pontibacter sp. G13]WNJ21566.1 hypothetical protein RJD25_28730 [Pontibacter sp. G13]